MIDPPQVRPEEPTAVTPHGGIRGGESQQWLSYPTAMVLGDRGRPAGLWGDDAPACLRARTTSYITASKGPLSNPTTAAQPWRRELVLLPQSRPSRGCAASAESGRVGMWRGGGRLGMSVSAPFVWRCLSGSAIAPFPHPSHRTQRADFPHCALGQDFTPSSTARRVQAGSDARARRSRRGARVDSCRPCFVWSCACSATTDATAQPHSCQAPDKPD